MNFLRWWWGLLLAFALLAVMRVFLPLPFSNEILIFSIYTMGCNYLLGRIGFISFGQPAYLAVGAYAAAFYLFYFGNNAYVGILIGVAAGMAVSFAIGPLFVRLRGDYFALVNLALAVIIFFLMQKVLAGITHGDNGLWFLTNLASTPVLDISRPDQFFIFSFLVAFVLWAFFKYLDDSIFGACCLATKINEDKVKFLGYSSFKIRLVRLCHRQHDHRFGRGDVCRLSRLRQPGDHQPGARRRSGGGDDPRRGRHAVRAHRRLDRLYRHEGRAQQSARQLGAGDRLRARVHHARRRKGHLGHARAADQKDVSARHGPSGRPRGQPMISMQLLTSGVIFGLSLGGIFFLMTIGLSLCFGLMRIISLDQLLYYSVGAYITYSVGLAAGNVWLGVLAGVVVAGLSALLVERVVFRRIYDRDLPFTMITSFAVLIGGVGVIKFFWGLVPRPVPEPITSQVYIFGTEIPVYRLVVIGIAALVYIGIWLFLNRTIIGKAIRAGTEDVEHVEGLGINVYRLFTITFVIAGGLSGLAGGLQAPLIMVDPQMGLEVLAFVFMVVIIGGLGSIKGTLISSFLVGQVVSIGSLIYAPLAQMAPFAIMLLILLIKPTGLFGSQMLKR